MLLISLCHIGNSWLQYNFCMLFYISFVTSFLSLSFVETFKWFLFPCLHSRLWNNSISLNHHKITSLIGTYICLKLLRTLEGRFIAEVSSWLPNPFPLILHHKARLYFLVSSIVQCRYRIRFQLNNFELDQCVPYIKAWFKKIVLMLSTSSCPSKML